MSEEVVVEDSVESKPKATEKVAEAVAEDTGVKLENVAIQEAKVEEDQKVIGGPEKPKRKPVSNVTNNDENIFSSKAANNSFKKIIEVEKTENKKDENKVALWSSKNIRWDGIGTLRKGYNVVSKEASEKWLSMNGIRNATPEEIATYYGK